MKIEIPEQAHADAIASIQRYFEENLPEPIGNLPAGLLLDFFIEEVGSVIYNRAIADAQARMAVRVSDLGVVRRRASVLAENRCAARKKTKVIRA